MTDDAREKPTGEWSRDVVGVFDEIIRSMAWIDDIASSLDLSEDQDYALRLCAEELLTNVVLHNGQRSPDGSALRIHMTLTAKADGVVLTIEDTGVPFDIVNAPSRTADQPLDRLQPGGLGVGLVKRFASRLAYRRIQGRNTVVVEFR